MMIFLLFVFLTICLKLRYRVKVKGLDKVLAKGNKGILFLPNHPALIDPVIMNTILFRKFHVRSLVHDKQVHTTALKYFSKSLRLLELPSLGVVGKAGVDAVRQQIENCSAALKQGDNILMYPAGRIYRGRFEKLRGNGGVAKIIEDDPDVRIVLVRTRGLWGSSFSRARGYQENFMTTLKSHIKHILLNLIFFCPRRDVEIEFMDLPEDFPKYGDKEILNRSLEEFYNEDAPSNTYVPYYWWERGGARQVPEPETYAASADTKDVPEEVRKKVYAKLHEISPYKALQDTNTLGTDLGLDSLMVTELQAWIQDEFNVEVNNPETLRTVGSVLLAAIGRASSVEPMMPIPPIWFVQKSDKLLQVPEDCKTVQETFLAHASKHPGFAIVADQATGVLTYRKMVLAIMVLKGAIEKIPEERVGILMPACAPAFVVYMATLFAGKIPVFINWTVGARNMQFCMKNAEVKTILTSRVVIERLSGRGTDFSPIRENLLYLEKIKDGISLGRKLWSLLMSRICWRSLYKAKPTKYAAILFTSGSENRPKTVPLTHRNVIADIDSAMKSLGLREDDAMLGMLPPFHSFGLLIDFLMPAIAKLRVVYHANPLEGNMLARIIAGYHMTMMVGTPTFVNGILRNATPAQMQSVRIVITGAEKCSDALEKLFAEMCPQAYFLEGYGITECSPVVALNRIGKTKKGSVGLKLDILKAKVCDENGKEVPRGTRGMLYLQGDSVFEGYLNYDGPSPFVEDEGGRWYVTGDLVNIDENDFITFMGRLKRFVKIGGEMVSLPAIEELLLDAYREPDGPLPLAISSRVNESDQAVIILFTTLDLDLAEVNQKIRDAGLSPIHFVKEIKKLEEIPLLGSGKTDYQTLKTLA